ncbi:hypothetical protein SLEP1_g33711 [Rubroshorea leprosula]|uniref:Uncharacterized protein n=1 Tax=Rubroshorea leprosula TaxID=152421 RepID=A0AAV5KHL1_9ROSI|nr:hypothetical protein SLEP1_g33711 [Rubroshorea leprosula]
MPLSFSSDLSEPLVKKLNLNDCWFVDTAARFKPPNEKSNEALSSEMVKIGSHELNIKSHFRD